MSSVLELTPRIFEIPFVVVKSTVQNFTGQQLKQVFVCPCHILITQWVQMNLPLRANLTTLVSLALPLCVSTETFSFK